MKTCKVYKMMVYARSISHMNQNDGFSRNLDSIKCFHQCLTRHLHSGRANLQNEFAHDIQTLLVSLWVDPRMCEKARCVGKYVGCVTKLCEVILLCDACRLKGLHPFTCLEKSKYLHQFGKIRKNINMIKLKNFGFGMYLFGDPTFIKWIMPSLCC